MTDVSRRDFLAAAAATPLARAFDPQQATDVNGRQQATRVNSEKRPTRVRTITAGVSLRNLDDHVPVEQALTFLEHAQRAFENAGYQVQTRRLAIGWLAPGDTAAGDTLDRIRKLDALAAAHSTLLNLGPVNQAAAPDDLSAWITEMLRATRQVSCSIDVADAEHGTREEAVRSSAEAISRIAQTTTHGMGNFRFAAAANIPPGTPFFPVARHAGPPAFAIGLESAGLVNDAFGAADTPSVARERLSSLMNAELQHAESVAKQLAERERRLYLGVDASPAPGMDRSIGRAIEALTHVPFGHASTLSACAIITDVLKRLTVKTCGYSGLMLPVLEDPVLAQRAREGAYGVQELLLYSSVCGTGLDVVPLAGDVPTARLAAIIHDVAALAVKWQKPLSARLFPVPGAKVGDAVHFDDPLLTDCVAMRLD